MTLNTTKLRVAMAEKGLRGTDVAKAIGISHVSMSRYLTGERTPCNKNLIRISHLLEVPWQYLVDFDVVNEDPNAILIINNIRANRQAWNMKTKRKIIDEVLKDES